MEERNQNLWRKPSFWAALGFLLFVFSVPVSNLLLHRQIIEDRKSDPAFLAFSKVIQTSCADCHTPGLLAEPVYMHWPVADGIIQNDVKEAQSAFIITREQLSGLEPISPGDLSKIAAEMAANRMPPRAYRALHWDSFWTDGQKKAVFNYVQKTSKNAVITPVPLQNPFEDLDTKTFYKKVALGEKLFHDKRLSGDGTVSCASCHSTLNENLPGNAPTVLNSAFNVCQYWDGRAKDLKEQAAMSLENPREMNAIVADDITKLTSDAGYAKMFVDAYDGPISRDTITDALASYEKTLLTPAAPFDKYLKGDEKAISARAKRGYQLFNNNGCATCHAGVNLGGMSFEKMGVKGDYFKGRTRKNGSRPGVEDNGRFNVTGKETDRFKFKVPTLRNIDRTGPYFHDGSAATLEDAVQDMSLYQNGAALSPTDARDIVEFLKTLTAQSKR